MPKTRSFLFHYRSFPFIIFSSLSLLLLLGSHLLDYYPWIFIVATLLFIDWKQIKTHEAVLVTILLFSMYITWYSLDKNIIYHSKYSGQMLLSLTIFLMGLSLLNNKHQFAFTEKHIFYLIYIFFVGYLLSLLYSYIFLDPSHPINREGMYVCFQNEYKRIHMNGGNLISTIIAYYLSPMAVLLPFLVFFFKTFKKTGFYTLEILFLASLSIFALFLAVEMQRRTVIFLFLISTGYFGLLWLLKSSKRNIDFKKTLFIFLILLVIASISFYFLSDTPLIKRLLHEGLHDKRFSWWSGGLQAMLDYPFGGGFNVILGNKTKLAHNLWIDIGKDFGIIPFIILILLSLAFGYRLLHFLFLTKASIFIKYLTALISLSILTIFMLEPVFNSDKTFFVYVLYFFGLLTALDKRASESKTE
jgi:hypothetical protein